MTDKIKELKEEQESLQKKTAIVLIIIVASFAITLFNYSIGIAGFIAALILYVFFVRKGKKDYKAKMKSTILVEGMRKFLKNPEYLSKEGISAEEVFSQDFIPAEKKEDIFIKDVIRATYRNKKVVLAEVTSNFHSVKNGKPFIDYVSGVLFDIDLGMDLEEMKLWIGEKKELPECYQPLLDSFHRLKKYTPGKAAMQVKDGHLRVFVKNRFLYTIDVPVRTEVTDKLVRYCDFTEVSYLTRMADTLL